MYIIKNVLKLHKNHKQKRRLTVRRYTILMGVVMVDDMGNEKGRIRRGRSLS